MSEEKRDRIRLGELLVLLRWLCGGWSQAMLARKSGLDESQISRYEAGTDPRTSNMNRLLAAFGISFGILETLRWALRVIRKLVRTGGRVELPPLGAAGEPIRSAVLESVDQCLTLGGLELALLRGAVSDTSLTAPTEEDHRRVDTLWDWLKGLPDRRRRLFIRVTRAFGEWLLCLRICRESEQAAADKPAEALEMAELALYTADQAEVPDAFRPRLKGTCTGFLANAQRVGSGLPVAESTFARAWKLWHEGRDEQGLLSEAYLLDLEASLRRAQRRLEPALSLHNRALAAARPDERGHFLLNKSVTLGEKGDFQAVAEALAQAAEAIDAERHPRLRFGVRFNQASALCRAGKATDAVPIVAEVKTLVEKLQNGADTIRTRWLEGNLAAGLGRRDEALSALEEVRNAFDKEGLAYDYALASLDLAQLYREQDRFAEIKALADEILAIFQAQNVHREALAAVILLVEAAEKEQVTTGMLRRLQDYLAKAKGDPELRFEG
jgi:tetratricopeptide (TPR) repeat protein/transcriptional regulator with XRE-family HTH domain